WDNLLDMRVQMVSSFQADQVVVRAWDMSTKQAVVGTASQGSMAPQIGESRSGSAISSDFGTATEYVVNQPLASQAEANTLAKALYDELDGTFVEAEGTCLGDPSLSPGMTVKFPTLGERLSGDYYLTLVTHSAG